MIVAPAINCRVMTSPNTKTPRNIEIMGEIMDKIIVAIPASTVSNARFSRKYVAAVTNPYAIKSK